MVFALTRARFCSERFIIATSKMAVSLGVRIYKSIDPVSGSTKPRIWVHVNAGGLTLGLADSYMAISGKAVDLR